VIPQDFLAQLLSRVDIVDVIDRRVPLRKAGQNYQACCPFHKEKTPSFTVSPVKQFYHCFGCGAHGSAIGFLMEYGGLGFRDAVQELAQSVGLKVPEDREAAHHPQVTPLLEVMQRAAQFYVDALRTTPTAIDYLKGRGVSGELARRYRLGWAPGGWQALAQAFPDYAQHPLLETAGLVSVGEGGRRYDRFRERVIYPIFNAQGNVIAFGGRVLSGDEGPKYLNSPETPLFSKGRELYGLFQAQAAIRRANRVLVVEGYMDVIAVAQSGVENVVATLGTATTETHVQRLLRLADDVVFAFDGDAAGQRAAWRALENALPALRDGKQIRFLFLPPEHDPDSYVRAQGRDAFERLIESALPLSAYWLRQLRTDHPGETAEAAAARASAGRAHLARVGAPMLRESLAAALARDCGLAASSLLLPPTDQPTAYVGATADAPAVPARHDRPAGARGGNDRSRDHFGRPAPPRVDPAAQQVRAAARRVLLRPRLAIHLVDLQLPEGEHSPSVGLLQAVVNAALRQGIAAHAGLLLEDLRETEFAGAVRELVFDHDADLDDLLSDEEIESQLRTLRARLEAGMLFARPAPVSVPPGLAGTGIVGVLTPRGAAPSSASAVDSSAVAPRSRKTEDEPFSPPTPSRR